MENENKDDIITSENNDDTELDLDLDLSEEEEKKEEKPTETPEAKIARLERQLAQARKKIGEPKVTEPSKQNKDELDYGQKAYLRAEGIKTSEEEALVLNVMRQTGKKLEEVLDSKYFQAELNEIRERKASENAIPNGSKRSGQTARDDVAYWLAKGELPPREEVELRRKVVNAKLAREKEVNVFSRNPIVGKY